MSILIYIIKTIFISGTMVAYYWLFLRNRPIHSFNRYFLLAIPGLSMIVPILHFDLTGFFSRNNESPAVHLLGVANGTLDEAVTIYSHQAGSIGLNWTIVALISCLGVSGWLFVRLFQSILYLRKLRHKNPLLKMPEANLYFVKEKGTPFSFFQSIFWEKDLPLNSRVGEQILRHELFHVKQWHSLDVMLMEILSGLMWFNPFLYMLRRELKLIHEYSADAYAAIGSDSCDYASLLVLHVNGMAGRLTHPFFKTHIKKRIAMIIKNRNHKTGFLGRLLFLPVTILLICLFAFQLPGHLHRSPAKKMRIVIDAGHGGIDPGKIINDIPEKNINLLIAKKIQLLAGTYGIEVVMTRDRDELPGQGDNIDRALNFRAGLPEKEHADLLISIHVNSTDQNRLQETHSGFDIYVPGYSSTMYSGSVKLASAVADHIKTDYIVASELKERTGRILILDKATVPSILIECGYMDNASDLKYLQDDKQQEKIARDILEGIQKYGQEATAYAGAPHENLSVTNNLEVNENRTATDNHTLSENIVAEKNLQLNQELQVNAHDSSTPYRKVDVESDFPGGQKAWTGYLTKNVKYPDSAVAHEIQGEVMVEFIVKKNGVVDDVHAISGPIVLQAESIRIIKESGKWIPAKNKGTKVDSYRQQPIIYKLEPK